MGSFRWTTSATKTYFDSMKEEYLQIRGNTVLVTEFMGRVRNWFFAQYPSQEEELKDREPLLPGEKPKYEVFKDNETWREARLTGIKFWFTNNTKKQREKGGRAEINISLGVEAGGSGSRKLTNEQVYSRLYYSERVREDAEAEIERLGATKEQYLSVRNRVIREKLENETEEVKMEVEKKKKEMVQEKVELAEAMKTIQDVNRGCLDFEELARVQKHIPRILELFLDALHTKTGWCFHIQAGGPQVGTVNAPIKYTSYSVGYLQGEVTFEMWAKKHGLWKDHWKPFSGFVHDLFPEEERLRMAVHIDDACIEDKDALGASGRSPGKLCFVGKQAPNGEPSNQAPDHVVVHQHAAKPMHKENGVAGGSEIGEGGSNSQGADRNNAQSTSNSNHKGGGTEKSGGAPETVLGTQKRSATAGSKRGKQKGAATQEGGKGIEKNVTVQPSAEPAVVLDPFGVPPILDQWTLMGQPLTNRQWDLAVPQSGLLLDDGTHAYGRSGAGINGDGEFGGANASGLSGNFGVDLSMVGLEARLGMSEAMFMLAGGDAPSFETAPTASAEVLSIPLTSAALVNPNFQMGHPVAFGSPGLNPGNKPPFFNMGFGQREEVAPNNLGAECDDLGGVHNGGAQPVDPVVRGNENDPAGNMEAGGQESDGGNGGMGDGSADTGNRRKRPMETCELAEERNKRARTAKKHPEWVDCAREYLLDGLDIPEWVALVDLWYQWEVRCSGLGGVINGTLPGAAARPAVVKKWLGGNCQWDIHENLGLDEILAFEERWVKWWNAMQPKVRRSADHGMPRKLDGTMNRAMATLRKAGESGFVLLLRALRMWAPGKASNERWDRAVQDVADVMAAVDLRAQ